MREKNIVMIMTALSMAICAHAQTRDTTYASEDSLPDGRYYRLFAPLTFFHSPAMSSLSLTDEGVDSVNAAIDRALMRIYLTRPDLICNTESDLEKEGTIRDDLNRRVIRQPLLTEKAPSTPTVVDEAAPEGILVKKPNFWTFSGDYSFQFIQNYVSGNWYKGGESNYSAVGSATMQANYDNKNKLKWENKLEMKLGFQTTRDDTIHSIKSNNDLLRYTGKLGLQATKNWYYTLQTTAQTQFTRSYKSNDETVYSDFLSPFTLNIGLGMDYKVQAKDNKLTGSVNLSPLAYNLKYVDRLSLATTNGIDEGKHSKNDFGSAFTVDLTWKFNDNVKWVTRLYGYTSYHRALLEWENTLTMQISKIIAATLFFYPRFDDSSTRDDELGYFQFSEYSSLGFTFSF